MMGEYVLNKQHVKPNVLNSLNEKKTVHCIVSGMCVYSFVDFGVQMLFWCTNVVLLDSNLTYDP